MSRTRFPSFLLLAALAVPLTALSGNAQTATPTFTTKLTAPTASVAPGTAATVTVQVGCTAGSLSNGVVDVEVYNAAGAQVKQKYWTGQSIASGASKSLSFSWSTSTAGTYTVKAGVFGANWAPIYHWNDTAGTITIASAPKAPAAPTGVTATAGNAQAMVKWTASTGATSYTVKRSTTSGGAYTAVASGLTAVSYTNTGLTNGTTYYYVVAAVNATGSSANSAQVSATPAAPAPTVPAAPTGLTAAPGDARASLAWTASSGATSYNVLRGTVSSGPYSTVATGVTATSYTNTGLTNGSTYYYVVAAVNAAGTSGNSAQASATPKAATVNPPPAGLPSFFGIGLANDPGNINWMTASNVAWSYRYQYLVGGVNTGTSWTTWNTPSAQFAVDYMNSSKTNGYIPVFTYYQLVDSAPNPGNENLDPKLQSAGTMKAYFTEWKLLMQKCGAFGGTVIVHVEPDGWGFMQQNHGDDPSKTAVSVASSGFAEAAGFENNARGFAQALASLRNAYAPNVLLAFHASVWATNVDLILNHDDPVVNGTRIANFFNGLNAGIDLVFTDPGDRDAGYYQYVIGDGGAHWWTDVEFTRYRQWLATITQATGRKAMIWQTPIGNTLYKTCNNTNDHYQDNRVQYFLGAGNLQHVVDYANAGVIGLMFGRGADGCTDYLDSAGDGVTNPAAVNGNTTVSNVSDDDGGYLRSSAGTYYKNGAVPLPK